MTDNPFDHSLRAKGSRATRQILDEFPTAVQISLAQFRDDILPYLAIPNNRDISYWMNYVKHPTVELHVMEPDNVTVKYIVPPMVERLGATAPGISGRSLHDKMIDARRRIERNPRSVRQELAKTLDPHINSPKGIIQNRIRLNNILVAEGYAPLPIPGAPVGFTGVTATSGTPAASTSNIKYGDEYDDI